jgi:hypothetical protein
MSVIGLVEKVEGTPGLTIRLSVIRGGVGLVAVPRTLASTSFPPTMQ